MYELINLDCWVVFFFRINEPFIGEVRSGWQNPHEVILRRYQMVFFNVEGPVTRRS